MAVKVKVCGITSPADAVMAVELGADYLGLNFYRASPRYVEPGRALEIAKAVRGQVKLVGVFVNSPRADVEDVAGQIGLDLLQFHGDEEPGFVAPFAGRAIKAFRTGGPPGAEELAAWSEVWGILIDAPHDARYGGTGAAWDYGTVSTANAGRLFLAGGLGPDNARRAVEAVRPYAIDICSRVESRPGIKDRELLRRLFQEVRHGETQTPP
ncbi:MAG: phosphoribosylanthranilate isomerase [Acidobacteriota bacterium]|jgi:phosphoribosylanthranilate isomerase|nr:phosphoribosylanthranilate isomerase [Acidobacteriota bacterium]